MTNRAKGITGIWSLTPSQVEVANEAPLQPKTGSAVLRYDEPDIELRSEDDRQVYDE